MHRYSIAVVEIARKARKFGLLRDLTSALQNLHPRFKSGRRLQFFFNDCGDSGGMKREGVVEMVVVWPHSSLLAASIRNHPPARLVRNP
jgi:hypothetical protein